MSSDLRRLLAAALAKAERDYRDAQDGLSTDATDAARARYAHAKEAYRRLESLLEETDPVGVLQQLQDSAWGRPRTYQS